MLTLLFFLPLFLSSGWENPEIRLKRWELEKKRLFTWITPNKNVYTQYFCSFSRKTTESGTKYETKTESPIFSCNVQLCASSNVHTAQVHTQLVKVVVWRKTGAIAEKSCYTGFYLLFATLCFRKTGAREKERRCVPEQWCRESESMSWKVAKSKSLAFSASSFLLLKSERSWSREREHTPCSRQGLLGCSGAKLGRACVLAPFCRFSAQYYRRRQCLWCNAWFSLDSGGKVCCVDVDEYNQTQEFIPRPRCTKKVDD